MWDLMKILELQLREKLLKKRESNINTEDLSEIGVYRSVNILSNRQLIKNFITRMFYFLISMRFYQPRLYKNDEVDDLKFISIDEMENLIKKENR